MTQGSGEVRIEAAKTPIASDAGAAPIQIQARQSQAFAAQDAEQAVASIKAPHGASRVLVDPAQGPGPAARDARDALEATRSRLGTLLETVEGHIRCGTLPLVGWGLSVPKVPTLSPEESGHVWSVIGDIHGDFVAWHRLLERVRVDPGFRLLFLGDLIDRGPHSLECVAGLLETALECPNQVLWVVGNHDEALRREAALGQFRSSVEPAEFVDELQAVKDWASAEQLQRWGIAFIEIARRLPRAVCFADGTLATHGGIPLSDHHPHLKSREALHWEPCLRDFTWTRAANKPRSLFDAERRRRGSSDFQFGFKDLDQFCAVLGNVLGSPVKRLVRGHDHVEAGVDHPSGFVNTPVVTLNGFGFHHLDNSLQRYKAKLPLGRLRQGEPFEIEDVPVEQPAYIIAESQAAGAPPDPIVGAEPQKD